MDYTVISFTQGTSESVPSIVEINVIYNGQAICVNTYFQLDWTIQQTDQAFSDACEANAQAVLACCSPTADNPNYDPTLTACLGG